MAARDAGWTSPWFRAVALGLPRFVRGRPPCFGWVTLQKLTEFGYHSIPRIRALGLALMQRGLHVGAQA
ncbi:hypothetical protein TWF132_002361 [Orbilia oligospora]|nr:hypothetical protein TWF751_005302 [Orbilia oligospora]KAF3295032.1 hypothetical protein TWF132_002361 [Orbilia oligospora]